MSTKRLGFFPLAIYGLLFLISAIPTVFFYVKFGSLNADELGDLIGFFLILAVLVITLGMGVAIITLILTVCKILHIATGLMLFGILCVIGDVIILFYLLSEIFYTLSLGLAPGGLITLLCVLFVLSFIFNLASLGR